MPKKTLICCWLAGVTAGAAALAAAVTPLPAQSMTIYSVTPAEASPGENIRIAGANFGASQGSKVVSLNQSGRRHHLTVTSWVDREVRATIPADLAPGNYKLLIYYDGSYSASTRSLDFRIVRFAVVMINRVRQIDDLDSLAEGGADFYARVGIDGVESTSPVSENRDDVTPQWTFTQPVTGESVPITIKLFEKDSVGGDDHCDINPRGRARDLSLTYNLRTGAVTGDATGLRQRLIHVAGGADDKRAQIWFTVYHR